MKRLTVVLLLLLALACAPQPLDYSRGQESPQRPVHGDIPGHGADVHMVTIEGVRCVVVVGYNGNGVGVDCEWPQ